MAGNVLDLKSARYIRNADGADKEMYKRAQDALEKISRLNLIDLPPRQRQHMFRLYSQFKVTSILYSQEFKTYYLNETKRLGIETSQETMLEFAKRFDPSAFAVHLR